MLNVAADSLSITRTGFSLKSLLISFYFLFVGNEIGADLSKALNLEGNAGLLDGSLVFLQNMFVFDLGKQMFAKVLNDVIDLLAKLNHAVNHLLLSNPKLRCVGGWDRLIIKTICMI